MTHIVRRTNAILVSLYKIRHHLSAELLKIFIQTHIFPHLQYCSSVWGGAASCRLDRLQKVIHFAARLVSGLRRHDHVTPTLRALGWSSVRTMVMRRDAMNVYRGLHVTNIILKHFGTCFAHVALFRAAARAPPPQAQLSSSCPGFGWRMRDRSNPV